MGENSFFMSVKKRFIFNTVEKVWTDVIGWDYIFTLSLFLRLRR